MKNAPENMPDKMREMRIEMHHSGGKPTGFTVHHQMEPQAAGKSGAFMEQTHHSFPFKAGDKQAMMQHIAQHLGAPMESKEMGEGEEE